MLLHLFFILEILHISSQIIINDCGVTYLAKDDIAMLFYLNIKNTCPNEVTVSAKMEKCCEVNSSNNDTDCKSINVIGEYTKLKGNHQRNVSLIYPNLVSISKRKTLSDNDDSVRSAINAYLFQYLFSRRGTCEFVVYYFTSDSEESHKITKSINFNTGASTCKSVDLNAKCNCAPVDCTIKYSGIKNYFNPETNLCAEIPCCLSKKLNCMPDIRYDLLQNSCRNIVPSVVTEDIALLENKKHTCPSSAYNLGHVNCHHGYVDKTGLCICYPGWISFASDQPVFSPSLAISHLCNIEVASWGKINSAKIKMTCLLISIMIFTVATKIIILMCLLNWCYKWVRSSPTCVMKRWFCHCDDVEKSHEPDFRGGPESHDSDKSKSEKDLKPTKDEINYENDTKKKAKIGFTGKENKEEVIDSKSIITSKESLKDSVKSKEKNGKKDNVKSAISNIFGKKNKGEVKDSKSIITSKESLKDSEKSKEKNGIKDDVKSAISNKFGKKKQEEVKDSKSIITSKESLKDSEKNDKKDDVKGTISSIFGKKYKDSKDVNKDTLKDSKSSKEKNPKKKDSKSTISSLFGEKNKDTKDLNKTLFKQNKSDSKSKVADVTQSHKVQKKSSKENLSIGKSYEIDLPFKAKELNKKLDDDKATESIKNILPKEKFPESDSLNSQTDGSITSNNISIKTDDINKNIDDRTTTYSNKYGENSTDYGTEYVLDDDEILDEAEISATKVHRADDKNIERRFPGSSKPGTKDSGTPTRPIKRVRHDSETTQVEKIQESSRETITKSSDDFKQSDNDGNVYLSYPSTDDSSSKSSDEDIEDRKKQKSPNEKFQDDTKFTKTIIKRHITRRKSTYTYGDSKGLEKIQYRKSSEGGISDSMYSNVEDETDDIDVKKDMNTRRISWSESKKEPISQDVQPKSTDFTGYPTENSSSSEAITRDKDLNLKYITTDSDDTSEKADKALSLISSQSRDLQTDTAMIDTSDDMSIPKRKLLDDSTSMSTTTIQTNKSRMVENEIIEDQDILTEKRKQRDSETQYKEVIDRGLPKIERDSLIRRSSLQPRDSKKKKSIDETTSVSTIITESNKSMTEEKEEVTVEDRETITELKKRRDSETHYKEVVSEARRPSIKSSISTRLSLKSDSKTEIETSTTDEKDKVKDLDAEIVSEARRPSIKDAISTKSSLPKELKDGGTITEIKKTRHSETQYKETSDTQRPSTKSAISNRLTSESPDSKTQLEQMEQMETVQRRTSIKQLSDTSISKRTSGDIENFPVPRRKSLDEATSVSSTSNQTNKSGLLRTQTVKDRKTITEVKSKRDSKTEHKETVTTKPSKMESGTLPKALSSSVTQVDRPTRLKSKEQIFYEDDAKKEIATYDDERHKMFEEKGIHSLKSSHSIITQTQIKENKGSQSMTTTTKTLETQSTLKVRKPSLRDEGAQYIESKQQEKHHSKEHTFETELERKRSINFKEDETREVGVERKTKQTKRESKTEIYRKESIQKPTVSSSSSDNQGRQDSLESLSGSKTSNDLSEDVFDSKFDLVKRSDKTESSFPSTENLTDYYSTTPTEAKSTSLSDEEKEEQAPSTRPKTKMTMVKTGEFPYCVCSGRDEEATADLPLCRGQTLPAREISTNTTNLRFNDKVSFAYCEKTPEGECIHVQKTKCRLSSLSNAVIVSTKDFGVDAKREQKTRVCETNPIDGSCVFVTREPCLTNQQQQKPMKSISTGTRQIEQKTIKTNTEKRENKEQLCEHGIKDCACSSKSSQVSFDNNLCEHGIEDCSCTYKRKTIETKTEKGEHIPLCEHGISDCSCTYKLNQESTTTQKARKTIQTNTEKRESISLCEHGISDCSCTYTTQKERKTIQTNTKKREPIPLCEHGISDCSCTYKINQESNTTQKERKTIQTNTENREHIPLCEHGISDCSCTYKASHPACPVSDSCNESKVIIPRCLDPKSSSSDSSDKNATKSPERIEAICQQDESCYQPHKTKSPEPIRPICQQDKSYYQPHKRKTSIQVEETYIKPKIREPNLPVSHHDKPSRCKIKPRPYKSSDVRDSYCEENPDDGACIFVTRERCIKRQSPTSVIRPRHTEIDPENEPQRQTSERDLWNFRQGYGDNDPQQMIRPKPFTSYCEEDPEDRSCVYVKREPCYQSSRTIKPRYKSSQHGYRPLRTFPQRQHKQQFEYDEYCEPDPVDGTCMYIRREPCIEGISPRNTHKSQHDNETRTVRARSYIPSHQTSESHFPVKSSYCEADPEDGSCVYMTRQPCLPKKVDSYKGTESRRMDTLSALRETKPRAYQLSPKYQEYCEDDSDGSCVHVTREPCLPRKTTIVKAKDYNTEEESDETDDEGTQTLPYSGETKPRPYQSGTKYQEYCEEDLDGTCVHVTREPCLPRKPTIVKAKDYNMSDEAPRTKTPLYTRKPKSYQPSPKYQEYCEEDSQDGTCVHVTREPCLPSKTAIVKAKDYNIEQSSDESDDEKPRTKTLPNSRKTKRKPHKSSPKYQEYCEEDSQDGTCVHVTREPCLPSKTAIVKAKVYNIEQSSDEFDDEKPRNKTLPYSQKSKPKPYHSSPKYQEFCEEDSQDGTCVHVTREPCLPSKTAIVKAKDYNIEQSSDECGDEKPRTKTFSKSRKTKPKPHKSSSKYQEYCEEDSNESDLSAHTEALPIHAEIKPRPKPSSHTTTPKEIKPRSYRSRSEYQEYCEEDLDDGTCVHVTRKSCLPRKTTIVKAKDYNKEEDSIESDEKTPPTKTHQRKLKPKPRSRPDYQAYCEEDSEDGACVHVTRKPCLPRKTDIVKAKDFNKEEDSNESVESLPTTKPKEIKPRSRQSLLEYQEDLKDGIKGNDFNAEEFSDESEDPPPSTKTIPLSKTLTPRQYKSRPQYQEYCEEDLGDGSCVHVTKKPCPPRKTTNVKAKDFNVREDSDESFEKFPPPRTISKQQHEEKPYHTIRSRPYKPLCKLDDAPKHGQHRYIKPRSYG